VVSDRTAGGGAVAGEDVDDASGEASLDESSAARRALRGVCSAGFMTMTLPQARRGPTFQAHMRSGKFHGMMTPQTPTGSRRVMTKLSPLTGMVLPQSLSAQPA